MTIDSKIFMRFILRILLSISLFLSVSISLFSQEIVMDTDTLTIFFRVNKHEYDPSYMGNEARMDKFLEHLNNSPFAETLQINFDVSSSPEGRYEFNSELSKLRAESVERYIIEHSRNSEYAVEVFHIAEAWEELEERVNESNQSWREDVLNIIRTYPQISTDDNGNLTEPRKQELMKYAGGRPWRYMVDEWFPTLRKFTVVTKASIHLPDLGEVNIDDEDVPFEELVVDDHRPVVSFMPSWKGDVTIKTNGIGWGMGHANVAAEIDLAPHWSVSVPFYYSGGIDYFTSGIKFRGIVLQPEARFYFKGNDGWYIGAHAGIGWYNFALNGEYRIQDHKGNRPAWGGGLGFGYQLQFKKNPRWGMEFALGAGVYDVKYDMFYNEENGPYAEVGIHDTFVGIDNATVAVTYKFPCIKKYPSKRKEGRK